MATKSFKGVFNSTLLKYSTTTSSSLRGFTQRRSSFVTIANHNNAARLVSVQTRNLRENIHALVARGKTPADSILRNHQCEGVRLTHNQPLHNQHHKDESTKNKTDKPTTTNNAPEAVTTTTEADTNTDADADADTDPSEASNPTTPSTPVPDDKPCTCRACHWFPFHRGCYGCCCCGGGGAAAPKLLSDRARDKLLQLAEDLVRYTPISEGPSTPPFDAVLRQRLAGDRRYFEPPPPPPPPPPPSFPRKDQEEGGEPSEGGGQGEGKDQHKDKDKDDMGRSGYETTSMGVGQKARPAGVGDKGVENKKQKQEVNKGDDTLDHDDHDNKNKTNGPAPLEKKERSIDDVRFLPGSGWTFWL